MRIVSCKSSWDFCEFVERVECRSDKERQRREKEREIESERACDVYRPNATRWRRVLGYRGEGSWYPLRRTSPRSTNGIGRDGERTPQERTEAQMREREGETVR